MDEFIEMILALAIMHTADNWLGVGRHSAMAADHYARLSLDPATDGDGYALTIATDCLNDAISDRAQHFTILCA